jgi:predicted nuclease of predicted toxin-antitoxin system
MKLLLDQGLPLSTAALLREVDVDAIHVEELGMAAAEDSAILRKAQEENRIVATVDADFHTLLAIGSEVMPSVIRIRIERLRARAIADLLLMVLSQCEEDLEQGAAVTVEPTRIRIRRLPLVPGR